MAQYIAVYEQYTARIELCQCPSLQNRNKNIPKRDTSFCDISLEKIIDNLYFLHNPPVSYANATDKPPSHRPAPKSLHPRQVLSASQKTVR